MTAFTIAIAEMTDYEINVYTTRESYVEEYRNKWQPHMVINYCDTPADYMRIAIKYNIDIDFYSTDVMCKPDNTKHASRFMLKEETGRAVCECFLKTRGYV